MSAIIFGKAHPFYSPSKVLFGTDTIKALGTEAKQLGGKKVLIVTDPGVVQANLLKPVKESLEAGGVPYAIYDQVKPEPPIRCVTDGVSKLKSEGCDLVVGIGGGSSLDVAKAISVLATNEQTIYDMFGMDLVKKRGLPKILVPTTSGTGSEVTRVFVVTDEKDNTKKVGNTLYNLADIAIVDPVLTVTVPPKVTADTGIDALVHAVETYVSTTATPFSDILAERPIEWISEYLPVAWAKGSDLEARYFMSLAATTAGMAFASGGLGAVHALAYVVGTEFKQSHGRSNAVMLPHIMRYNIPGNAAKFADIAALMGEDIDGLTDREAALLAVEAVEDLLTTVGISFQLRDYGIKESDVPKLVEGAMKFARLFTINPRDLTEADVRSIYEEAY